MENADNRRMAFDFELGDVKRSPCRGCYKRGRFPGCMDGCAALDHFQRVLARTVSCSRDSGLDAHAVYRPDPYRSGM
ncbi:MAG: hypothetical protein JEZ11_27315 [Desulfobacterales bacterium]|nr:hypothetical protein [Desulfobacterales bacterium]